MEWSPQAVYSITRVMSSGLDGHRAGIYYKEILLPIVQRDIRTTKKLNVHLYNSLIKGLYKPVGWVKGFLVPFVSDPNCSLKEAQIIASLIQKVFLIK